MTRIQSHITALLLLSAIVSFAPLARAEQMQSTVGLPMHAPNFRLLDAAGVPHELAALKDARAVVLFVQMNGCPIVRQSYPYMEEIRAKYEPQGVTFLYVNSNPWDTDESIVDECKEYSATVPVLRDMHRALAHALGFKRSAETFVIDPKSGDVIYRGMADDRFDYGLQRMSPSKFWLKDTLEAIVTGGKVETKPTIAKGCVLDLDFSAPANFAKDVVPILTAKFPTQYGATPDENTVRMHDAPLLSALLTGHAAGREIQLTDDEADALVAWMFTPSADESHHP